MKFQTNQESFCAGKFGSEYIKRNQGDALLASNLNFFSRTLRNKNKFNSCIEFGANIGMNLKALKLLYPNLDIHALEIIQKASKELGKFVKYDNLYNISILDFKHVRQWDLTP